MTKATRSEPRWKSRAVAVSALGLVVATSAACTSASTPPASGLASKHTSGTPAQPSTSSSAPAVPAVITTGAAVRNGIDPTTPITLSVSGGKFTDVTMTNEAGKHVSAQLGSGDTTWRTTEDLGYDKTYTVVAHAVASDGTASTKRTVLTTLKPAQQTDIDLQRMGGYALDEGATYGVAIVPVVHFELAVQDRRAAQQALSVHTSTPVRGVWSWIDDKDVAYRPESYWPAHTTVSVSANAYGVNLGGGNYGSSDQTAHFTVGRKQLTVADDNAPQVDKVRVYNAAGKVLRTMNTSMGQHSGETVNGQYINFYTLDGTYTVLEHDNPAIMSSQSYGLPQDAPNGYGKLTVPYSTKVSVDGIYLHEYNSTIYDQDHGNDVSEGCLNLRTSDAVWFYDHSVIGDPVVVHGAKGAPEIQPDEGGYWSIPWSTWLKNTA